MAKSRKSRSRKRRAAKCKVVTVCGKRRKLCWDKKGKITSNTPKSGGRRKSRKKSATKKRNCRFGYSKRLGRCKRKPGGRR